MLPGNVFEVSSEGHLLAAVPTVPSAFAIIPVTVKLAVPQFLMAFRSYPVSGMIHRSSHL